jgi:hypothetical protein
VARHLRQVRATNLYRALVLTALAILVREGREIPARILLEFLLQLPNPIVVHSITSARYLSPILYPASWPLQPIRKAGKR